MNLPPRWAEKMIAWLAPDHLADEIRGDLYEMYFDDLLVEGVRKARRRYVVRTFGFLVKNFFWKKKDQFNNYRMTGNYFKMARRNLAANKGTTIINILGLVIGIASSLVILSVIRFEESFDTFHSKKDGVYRLVRISGSTDLQYRSGISYPVPEALKNEIPAIDIIAAVDYFGSSNVDVLSSDGKTLKKFMESSGIGTVQPEFFQIFDFAGKKIEWIAGNRDKALIEPSSVVITKEIAKKYFGNDDPLGQSLRFQQLYDFKITGVIDDFPTNTDFPFKFIMSYSTMDILFKDRMKEWVSVNDTHSAFIYAPNISKQDLEARIDTVHAHHVGKDVSTSRHYRLQEISELHYDPRFGNFSHRTITHETLLALKIIVLFLLLAGCINYINLSTAQATLRSKEIGLRKVMGSTHRHLIFQFLTETFVVVMLAAIAAGTLVLAFMPSIGNLLNLNVTFDLTDPFIISTLITIVLSVTLFSGLYPAFVISRFNPIASLRNKFSNEKVGGVNLRKVLVVAQFTITQILAVGTFIVISQMEFFQNVDMGFNRSAVVVTMRVFDNNPRYLQPMMNDLRGLSFVSKVSAAFTLPSGVDRNRSSRNIGRPDAASLPDYLNFEYNSIDEDYMDLYGIKLLEGRTLTLSDTIGGAILINETLRKNLQAEVGEQLKLGSGDKVTVVGVVNDYYSNSLKEGIDNMVIDVKPNAYRKVSILLDLRRDESMSDALAEIERTWNKHYPDVVFNYVFQDDNIAAFYQQEFKYSRLFQMFSVIFIGIGCLGLYGLITFIANKKGKEIAIRKTLGATISNIIVMFSKEYVTLIAISFALAVPVVWYGVNEWLTNFQNHIQLQWWMFAAPGLIVLALALLVVGSKSYNAASANPVDKLKNE